MAQNVSERFKREAASPVKSPEFAVLISWDKAIRQDSGWFKLDTSMLDGDDTLQGATEIHTLYDKYEYANESKFVKNFEISRKVSNYGWGVIMATARITLKNGSGRFTPGGGSLGDLVRAGRPVKIAVGYNGELMNVFTGFLGAPKLNLVENTVEFEAFDTMTYFAGKETDTTFFQNKPISEVLDSLLREQGFGVGQYEIDPSLSRKYPFLWTRGRKLTAIFKEVATNETALIYTDENGVLKFVKNSSLMNVAPRNWEFNYSNLTDLNISESNIINMVKVKSSYLREAGIGTVYQMREQDRGGQWAVENGKTKDFWFEPSHEGGLENLKYVKDANGSFQFYANAQATGSEITTGVTKTFTNFYDSFKLTVKNNSGRMIYLGNAEIYGAIVNEITETPVIVQNAPSIEKYGINPDSSTGMLGEPFEYETTAGRTSTLQWASDMTDFESLRGIGEAFLDNYAEPNQQYSVSNFMVPHLQVGDTVGVSVESLNKDFNCAILGVTIKGGVRANFRQELYLQVIPDRRWFTLNISKLDSGDILL